MCQKVIGLPTEKLFTLTRKLVYKIWKIELNIKTNEIEYQSYLKTLNKDMG